MDGEYSLVFVAFSTLFALLTQDDQVRCFQNVARALARGGVFVVQAFVPDPGRFDRGQRVGVTHMDDGTVRLEVSRHDPVAQAVDTHHVELSAGGILALPLKVRYAWPAELDLMARMAGLERRERWGGWDRQAFGPESAVHVSLYEHRAS